MIDTMVYKCVLYFTLLVDLVELYPCWKLAGDTRVFERRFSRKEVDKREFDSIVGWFTFTGTFSSRHTGNAL